MLEASSVKKGLRVIVARETSLQLTTVERQERNRDDKFHCTNAYSVSVEDMFPYTPDGIKNAVEHLREQAADRINTYHELISKTEAFLEKETIRLHNYTPQLLEEYNYTVSVETGKVIAE